MNLERYERIYDRFTAGYPVERLAYLFRTSPRAIEMLLQIVEIRHNGKSTIPTIPETFAISENRRGDGQWTNS
jgi:hypothetical protein